MSHDYHISSRPGNIDRRLKIEEDTVKCVICKQGETYPGETTVTLKREITTVIVKNVRAEICEICGEYYLSEDMTRQIRAQAERAVRNGAEDEIVRYAA